jgi:hypothetical protein
MIAQLVSFAFPIIVHTLALSLFIYLGYRGCFKRLPGVSSYLFALLLIDAVGRRYVYYHYGVASNEYRYFYWLTDVALALGAFLLICTFFQRACANETKMWRLLRVFLVFVFVLVLGISAFSLSRNYSNLWSRFIYEFQQNLYFTCLVLNTLLYILMQQIEATDEELSMLVCGLGLQFAGPAANLALVFLTPGHEYAKLLYGLVGPLCTLGMLLTWFYAVARMPKSANAPAVMQMVPAFRGRRQVA